MNNTARNKAGDITDYLEELFPLDSAMNYDNPGYITGSSFEEVRKAVLALDATTDAVEFAANAGADMLIVHHPLIFGGIRTVCEDDIKGNIITNLIRRGVTSYAAHTNLDINNEFSNRILAQRLGLRKDSIEVPEGVACGVRGKLTPRMDIGSFAHMMKEALDCSGVITYAPIDREVRNVFVQGGAFDEESIPVLPELGIDTVVSGEIKHHIMLELEEYGISGIIAGHNATERPFMENLTAILAQKFPGTDFIYYGGSEQII